MQRAIGLFASYTGADLSNHVAAVLMGTDLPGADHTLADLADVHVLHETTLGRFRFHDLFRLYAAERADPDPDALRRLGDWYVAQARAAAALIAPNMTRLPWRGMKPEPRPTPADAFLADAEGALGFIDAERHNLLAIIELCAGHGLGEISWLLADAARGYYYQTRCMRDWAKATEIGLRMARQHADHSAIAAMLASRALSALAVGDFRRSAEFNNEALRHATEDNWTEGIAMITSNLGMACYNLGQLEQAHDAYAKAMTTNRAIGNHGGEAVQLANLAGVHHALREAKEALRRYGEALAIYAAAGAFESVALTHVNRANVYMTLGRPDGALAAAKSALEIYGARGSRAATCLANIALARALLACGQRDAAFESAQRAYASAQAIGDRRIEVDALNTLGEVAIADANITDADGFLTAAYNIAATIAYGLGVRDARKARRALDVARQAVKIRTLPLLTTKHPLRRDAIQAGSALASGTGRVEPAAPVGQPHSNAGPTLLLHRQGQRQRRPDVAARATSPTRRCCSRRGFCSYVGPTLSLLDLGELASSA